MSEIINLQARRAPVTYTVRITQHWSGTLETFVEDVADDPRSRASVIEALQRASGLQDVADVLHGELLTQIDGLMSAEAGTPESEKLSQLADIVSAYEAKRFPSADQ